MYPEIRDDTNKKYNYKMEEEENPSLSFKSPQDVYITCWVKK